MKNRLSNIVIGIKGAGEMASAIAWRLYMANLKSIYMMEVREPLAVRRHVAFSEAVYCGTQTVEGVEAIKTDNIDGIKDIWKNEKIALVIDPEWQTQNKLRPDVMVDAILAKRNLGTKTTEADLVIGLGPGFVAGRDVHMVIETNRGHHLGRIMTSGEADPNTGIPGTIGGYASERVLRAPKDGVFRAQKEIGELVSAGELIGTVDRATVTAQLDGVLRGLIRPDTTVQKGLKLGDIDPRGRVEYCATISDKARAIAGSVLEAVLRVYHSG